MSSALLSLGNELAGLGVLARQESDPEIVGLNGLGLKRFEHEPLAPLAELSLWIEHSVVTREDEAFGSELERLAFDARLLEGLEEARPAFLERGGGFFLSVPGELTAISAFTLESALFSAVAKAFITACKLRTFCPARSAATSPSVACSKPMLRVSRAS